MEPIAALYRTLSDAARSSNCGVAWTANCEIDGRVYGHVGADPTRRKAWGRRHETAPEVELDFARLHAVAGRDVWRPVQA